MPHRNHAPTPSLNLQIPSAYDFLPLDTRIFLPQAYTGTTSPPTATTTTTEKWHRKLAVFAHPYAMLGGTFDDPVVVSVVGGLLLEGWVVASFNFRGANGSKGKTTWTGKAEIKDYLSVVTWALAYVQSLPSAASFPPASSPTSLGLGVGGGGLGEEGEVVEVEEEEGEEEEMELLLGGYSYGALIASQVPHIEEVLGESIAGDARTPFSEAVESAKRSARRWLDTHSSGRTSYSGTFNRAQVHAAMAAEENTRRRRRRGRGNGRSECNGDDSLVGERKWRIGTRYLLVSPPLPPISFLLGFGIGGCWNGVKARVGLGHYDKKHEEVSGMEKEGARVFAVYGDRDSFTGVRKYRMWAEKMVEARGKGMFSVVEVEGAGHFWRGESAMRELLSAVCDWVR